MMIDRRKHGVAGSRALDVKLASYAVASAAALAVSAPAYGAIVYQAAVNTTVNETGVYRFNLTGASSADITISAEPDLFTNAFNNVDATTVASAAVRLDPAGGPPQVSALAFGALIDPTSATGWGTSGKLVSSFPGDTGSWSATGGSAYLGFYFGTGATKQAGWAQLSTTAGNASSSFTVNAFAYETIPGQSITAGQTSDNTVADVPEPSSMALLAVGGAGLLALRRRRRLDA